MNERSANAAQSAIAAAHRCDPSVCPDAQTLIAFADGRLPAPLRDQVAASVAACAGCAAAVRLALDASSWADDLCVDIERAGQHNNVQPLLRPGRLRRQSWLPLAMAASLALFVGAGMLLRRSPVEETLRGRTGIATTPVDGALLRQAPQSLSWPCAALPSAALVELFSADATLRWSGVPVECMATLPAQIQSALTPGEYLWRVKNAAGETLLGPVAFRIAS
ncbi:MAG: hypothetical protein SGI99_02300 [Pseudomonadota bacterium]|nr:hypothetical protein [Pseudomonadota bacterium]